MRTEVVFLIISLIFVDLYRFCYASHFRGGYITWRPVDNTSKIEIIYRISWRRSYGSSHYCDSDTIVNDELNSGEGIISCQTCHLPETIGPMTYKCTDFSQIEDWTTGTNSILFDYGNNKEFYIGYSSGGWIALQYGGGTWSVMTLVKTSTRNDTQKLNTSPITSMQPLTRLSLHCHYKIRIPVNDVDGDTVRCRWANSTYFSVDECAGVCNALPGSNLIEETCELNYTADTAGYFAVALQIEDFTSPSSNTPLSSVPLQFLILVSDDSSTCTGSPTFSIDTIMDGTTLYVTSGELFSLQIVAVSSSDSTSIREIITVSPVNMTKSSLLELGNMTEMWSINVSWTPTAVQAGDHIFCFSAIDGNGLSSEQRCITLIVDGKQLEIVTTELTTATTLSPDAKRYYMFALLGARLVFGKDRKRSSNGNINTGHVYI